MSEVVREMRKRPFCISVTAVIWSPSHAYLLIHLLFGAVGEEETNFPPQVFADLEEISHVGAETASRPLFSRVQSCMLG